MRRSNVLFLAMSLLLGAAATRAQDKPNPVVSTAAASLQIPPTDDGLPGQGPIRRYDWFRNLWSDRRTKWATRVEADQGAVVFLGDSITRAGARISAAGFPA